MKCSIPEISWHNREPVLSIDVQPLNSANDFYRLATAGSDNLVLIWKLTINEEGKVDIQVLSELARHQKAVNVVKWSPNGELLASGDDDAHIILWQMRTDNIPSLDERENEFEERWNMLKVLRGHKEDVYDICWSPSSDKILSGSVDNTAIIWDVAKGKIEQIISDHKGFVQGVAWDPKNQYLATLSSDRVCRVFASNGRRIKARLARGVLPVAEEHELFNKEVKFFHDDTFKTFFRRLSFTPDGSLLLVPSGAVDSEERKNVLFGTFAFTLDALSNPSCIIPSGKQCSIVVKCSPVMYELRETGPKAIVDLPYRMIIAVATDSDLILYDTQQNAPCVHLQNIHYTRLTDLTWSPDGLLLAASSTDGFITLITFKPGELGTPYTKEESDAEESVMQISMNEEQLSAATEPMVVSPEKPKTSSFLEQWAKQAKKRKVSEEPSEVAAKQPKQNEIGSTQRKEIVLPEVKTPVTVKKRITPILISKETSPLPKVVVKLERMPQIEKMKSLTGNTTNNKKRIQPIKIGVAVSAKKESKTTTPKVKPTNGHKITEENNSSKRPENKTSDAKENSKKPANNETSESVIVVVDETNESNSVVDKTNETHVASLRKVKPCSQSGKKQKKIDVIIDVDAESTSKSKVTPKRNITTPKSAQKSGGKKPVSATPTGNTILNYLKPLNISASSKKESTPKQKEQLKPQKLTFPDEDDADDKANGTHSNIKISTKSLFKKKGDKTESRSSSEASKLKMGFTEDTTEVPDDFVLEIIDSDESANDPIEKENTDVDKEVLEEKKSVPLKQPRRIPLITLASPKNKKKPPTE